VSAFILALDLQWADRLDSLDDWVQLECPTKWKSLPFAQPGAVRVIPHGIGKATCVRNSRALT
jgi:hypothetical protein